MIRSFRALALLFVATLASMGLAACSLGDSAVEGTPATESASAGLDPIFAEPKAGDLFAAELSHFSSAIFSDESRHRRNSSNETMYGLLSVVSVGPKEIVVITEKEAWPMSSGAVEDLEGDLADIEWDTEEEITLDRSQIASLVKEGKLIQARRPAN